MTCHALHRPCAPDLTLAEGVGHVRMSLCLPKDQALPQYVFVRSEPHNEEHLSALTLSHQMLKGERRWSVWEGELRLNDSTLVTLYCFKLVFQETQFWLSAYGITSFFPERDTHFRCAVGYEPARWMWSCVFYQIFPDRFYDGNTQQNVRLEEYLYEGQPVQARLWGALPDRSQGQREFFGGDLQGIVAKLEYLQTLGVKALYLNPLFTAPSSHKYDTLNYYEIDPHLGGEVAFLALCQALKTRGMRLILDAVVNHTSERHPWFDRYGEHHQPDKPLGAYQAYKQGVQSPLRNFYTFHDPHDPESYEGWLGKIKTLPVLNYAEPGVLAAFCNEEDGILRHWLRPPYAVDGWRFDVIHMVGDGIGARNTHQYARAFRKALREENPEALMLGEHFFEASDWLQGDQEDACMNYYGFTRPLWNFLVGRDVRHHPVNIDAEAFEAMLSRARARLPFDIQLSQLNLLSSHDTPRLLTLLEEDKASFRLALTFLMTHIGVPCVYYGDEIGMLGGPDPDCRRCFDWDERTWDKALLGYVQQLIYYRNDTPALQQGTFQVLYAQKDGYAFARSLAETHIVTVLNRGEEMTLTLPVWRLGIESGLLHLDIASQNVTSHTYVVVEGHVTLPIAASCAAVFHIAHTSMEA